MPFLQLTYYRIFSILLVLSPATYGQEPPSKPLKKAVSYNDFGAKGDGKTDDFEALAKAHEYANKNGLSVRASDGATYLIGGANRTIIIQTNTDFGTAKFIIDDTKLENVRANVFEVRSDLKAIKLKDIKSLKRGQTKININLPRASVITATNSKVKRFIRRGSNQNNGSSQTDTFLVDKEGNVNSKTSIIWDFDQLTKITAQPIDQQPLTITGGKFTTIANTSESSTYHARGIQIRRSNVIIDGLVHTIRGEGEQGAPYRGFITISDCANVMVKNTILTGHKTYHKIGSAGKRVAMGSYDISLGRALNVTFLNCSQSNDIMDSKYWGVMGSNFCKNLTLDGCKFSRFDAHQGVTNATIRNSTLGYMGVKLTGSGSFLIENSSVHGRYFIDLRSDYGSTWRGDVIIRNCQFFPRGGSRSSILGGRNDGQHDFGYTCYMPASVIIDKLHIADSKNAKSGKGPALFANFNSKLTNETYKQEHPYMITQEVRLKNVTTTSGQPLRVSDNSYMFKEVKIEGLEK